MWLPDGGGFFKSCGCQMAEDSLSHMVARGVDDGLIGCKVVEG